MTVLARLRGGHIDDLARATWGRRMRFTSCGGKWAGERTLDDDVAVLAKGRALHGEGERGTGAGLFGMVFEMRCRNERYSYLQATNLLKVVLVALVVRHG